MTGLLLLLLPVFGVLLFFFPKTISVIACLPWAYFLLTELLYSIGMKQTLKSVKDSETSFTPDELTMFARYAFFFHSPYPAMGISNAAPIWMMSTIPWALVLGLKGEWAFIICPLLVLCVALYLTAKLHPVLYLSQAAKRNPTIFPAPSNEAGTFLLFVEVCKKSFVEDHPIRHNLTALLCDIWPDGLFAAQNSPPRGWM